MSAARAPCTHGRRAIFFDRDGVLNRALVRNGKPYPPTSLDELEIPESVPHLLRAVQEEGFLLIGVTNQPDVARGTQSPAVVEAINAKVLEILPLAEVFVCCHDDPDQCDCRKPKPGLLLAAAGKYGIDLSASFMIGDRWRDVEAGRRAGCRTVWINYNYDERWQGDAPDRTVGGLGEAIEWILGVTAGKGLQPMMRSKQLSELRVKIFADGADKAGILRLYANPLIKGFTTNPTLMRKAGVSDYEAFAREILAVIPDRPISFEVCSDEFDEMARQARRIATWGDNVYVKIPITNTRRQSSIPLIRELAARESR